MKNITVFSKSIFLAISLMIISVNVFPMRMSEMGKIKAKKFLEQLQLKKSKSFRELIILLDDSEVNNFGGISQALLTALYQEAAPIITSMSLFYTLMDQRGKDKRDLTAVASEMEYAVDRSIGRLNPAIDSSNNVLISRLSFQPDQWIVKKINKSLILLIPTEYLNSLEIDKDQVEMSHGILDTFSDVELKLGLKVNHMETITYDVIRRSIYMNIWNFFFKDLQPYATYFINNMDNIFCKKTDYTDYHETIAVPRWIIYIGGHGTMNSSIVDLSLDDFKKFLQFVDSKIITHLLVVGSCYATGVNINQIYGQIESETQKYYSFPIIIHGLNDMNARLSAISFDIQAWRNDKKIQLKSVQDFTHFFQKAKNDGQYNEAIRFLMNNEVTYIQNTPQIKLPGIGWFSVMDIDNKIVSISAETWDSQEPLNIQTFFNKNPEALLLYTDDIPFELVTNAGLKEIVSMVSTDSGFVIHKIKKISSAEQSCLAIFRCFRLLEESEGFKLFFIDEVADATQTYKDVLIYGRTGLIGDILGKCVLFYFKNKDNVLIAGRWKETEKTSGNQFALENIDTLRNLRFRKASKLEIVYYQMLRNYYLSFSKNEREPSAEQIKKIENQLAKQQEEMGMDETETNVSEPSVD